MTLKFFIIPALIATALFAQRPRATHTPPTPAQVAANQLTRIARFLKLDSADTSKLTGNTSLVGYIEAEQTALQSHAAALKTAYSALATDVVTNNTADAATQENTIESTTTSNFKTRVTAAGEVVGALPSAGLSVTLTSAQFTGAAQLLIDGGGFGRF